ncbi:hypothetical protein H632_c1592p1 [Helicosporidium sp. ATCC 50920]|nr:hypothetical protein H632_c1592p1 [Helicosporidium sp. ATCC 50920]|eukprot:KDD74077.1 hypothetical protein H632_c1592p1 [Helicosporidium sp. ATCC 50920]
MRHSVVLEKDVASMGRAGELLTVSPGHYRNHLLPYRLAHAVRGEQLEEKTEAQFSVKKAVASQSAESLALARALQMRRTIMVRVALQEARLPPSRGRKPKLGKEPRVKATAAVVAKTQPRRLARPVAAADVVQAVEAALGRAVDVERLYLPVVETEDKVSIAITFRGGGTAFVLLLVRGLDQARHKS